MVPGDFKNFLSKTYDTVSDLFQRVVAWFRGWVQKFSSTVLNSIRMESKETVSFQLPPVTLSESTNYVGGPGNRMLQNIDTSDWRSSDRTLFAKKITKNIGNIASLLGFQFEIEVVMKLIQKHRLRLVGSTFTELQSFREQYIEKIQVHLGTSFVYQQFDKYVESQAAQLAQAIYNKSAQLLNCNPIEVIYNIRTNHSSQTDLKLTCTASNIDWSLKYVSQPKVTIRTLSVHDAYQLLGGKDKGRTLEYYKFLMNTSDTDELRNLILDDLELAIKESNWLENPQNFANLLTYLLRGDEKATLGIVNYVTNKQSAGDPSSNITKDFMVRRTRNGLIFNAKSNAKLELKRAKHGLRIKYQGDSPLGTTIQIEFNEKSHQEGGIRLQFKVNNLL